MKETVTLAEEAAGEYEEKRSRFLCLLCPVTTPDQAAAVVERVKKQHYDARHNCWAYLLSDGNKRCSDDGEPQGTAGLPILDALEKSGVTDVVAVVTRYFGGVLLGAGGLVRAYSKATGDALSNARKCRMLPCTVFTVSCPYGDLDSLKRLLDSCDAAVSATDYGVDVTLSAALPSTLWEEFCHQLTDRFNGRLTAKEQGEEKRPVLL